MIKLPVTFLSSINANGDFLDTWNIQSSNIEAVCSVPVEFGGAGGGFSPEDLFLQALINCFVGTFKVYANASRATFSNLSVKGALNVDKNAEGKICMKSCLLEIEILGAEKPERIQSLVNKALRDGFILNSVRTEIETKLRINEVSVNEAQ